MQHHIQPIFSGYCVQCGTTVTHCLILEKIVCEGCGTVTDVVQYMAVLSARLDACESETENGGALDD